MTTLGRTQLQGIIDGARAPEARLPESQPLSLTRNFVWVFALCGAMLMTVPVLVVWVAGMVLR
jgi:hypothetical protein